MNLPNVLTLSRILITPVFLVLLVIPLRLPGQSQWLLALIVFILASLTDMADGYLARKHNLVTNLGKFLDPLADKLLVAAALIGFTSLGLAPAWVVWLILAREFAVTGLRAIVAQSGVVIAAGLLGKWKTVTQMAGIILIMLEALPPLAAWGIHPGLPVLYIALVLTLISGAEYIYNAREELLK
jgi:CDP-diacylglycerol--glycerol-3-phosphate 3-phosphatidyltransferase